ncbi:MAG TPA: PhnD/SsuA/transferrin family substrate-binding protein [Thermoanaerobaculia bacterium]|nr:PhnD/SsuA/transferrin family substrate-binding protein [Thermoanaerobaculia bacterium]
MTLAALAAISTFIVPRHVRAADEQQVAIDYIAKSKDSGVENPADEKLREYFATKGIILRAALPNNYFLVIDQVLRAQRSNPPKPVVARMTPFAFVAAELQGAHLEKLAAYRSGATNELTYHAYFAVRGQYRHKDGRLITFSKQPTLREIDEFLTNSAARPKFGYHDKFSTSSYFLPWLHFRRENFYDIPEATKFLKAIAFVKVSDDSDDLLSALAKGRSSDGSVALEQPDIVAVWDGTKKEFESRFPDLRFVQLDEALPNDLLVCSDDLPDSQKKALKEAIAAMRCTPGQLSAVAPFSIEFLCWTSIGEANDARVALADLERRAVAQARAPVSIEVIANPLPPKTSIVERKHFAHYVDTVKESIRLAGTEFVLFDPDVTDHADVEWNVASIHDGAIKLTSIIRDVDGVAPQEFTISFPRADEDPATLRVADDEISRRIVATIQSRMDRIRYVWPFMTKHPIVIRDVGFSPDPKVPLVVQHIKWTAPEKGASSPDGSFSAMLTPASNIHVFELDSTNFRKIDKDPTECDFNAMSNEAYRVILVPPSSERPLFRYLTVILIALFAIAAAAAARDVVRMMRTRIAGTGPRTRDGARVAAPGDAVDA